MSISYNYEARLYLLSEYMKSYIDVSASFYKDENKEQLYIKGAIAYQETLLVQTLSQCHGAVYVNGLGDSFKVKEKCICSFDSFQEALLGEMDYLKDRNRDPDDFRNLCEMPESLLKVIKD